MTSSAADGKAVGAPRRRATTAPLRRLSGTVLIVGTVVALLAAVGPLWMVRLGLGVAVVSAVLSCTTAWRELSEARRAHAKEMLATSRASGAALREERRHNASVVDVLTARAAHSAASAHRLHGELEALGSRMQTLSNTIAGLRAEIRTLSRSRDEAVVEGRRHTKTIAALQETLRAREAELREVSGLTGQVRSMPRRMRPEDHEFATESTRAEELRTAESGSAGRSADVAQLVQETVSLPNYEGERKLA